MNPQPPPRKRMKTGITRVRTGCYTCRRRKVKCDEEKPACKACSQLGLQCEGYALRYRFCDPQTSDITQWAPTFAPERVLPAGLETPSHSPNSSSSRSDSSLESQTTFCFAAADNLESSQSSMIDLSGAISQTQFHVNASKPLSPFNDAFLDTVDNWASTPEDSTLSGRMSLSAGKPGTSFSDDMSRFSDYGDPSHRPAMRGDIPSYFNDRYSPLCRMPESSNMSEFYFSQWHNGVVTLLPPVFRDITTEMPDFQPLRNAVLAVSAAYVAHLESLIVRAAHRSKKSYYIPQRDHQYQSLQYYNKVIQGIGRCVEMRPQINSLHVLAALLLSYYFELNSGSFAGGMGHMTVTDKFLSSHHDEIKTHALGRKLLSTWMNLRSQFVNRYLGSYIPSMSSHSIDTFPLNRMIADEGSHHDSITIMMCDCKVLSRKIILDWCVTRNDTKDASNNPPLDNMLSQLSLPMSRAHSASQLAAVDSSYMESLDMLQTRLDQWHSSLELCELPVESYTSKRQPSTKAPTTESETLDILPLKFHTFESAMNYAYYAHAQMMCTGDVFDRLKNPKFVVPPLTRKDCPWPELILRITAGLQVADCIYKNTFNAGILHILTACMVLCPRADVAAWIEEWVRKVEDFGVPLESGLPFGIIKRIIQFILDQRKNGRDILLILPIDTEDAEKSDLYQSDFRMEVVVCGKDMQTGQLFHNTVEIPEL